MRNCIEIIPILVLQIVSTMAAKTQTSKIGTFSSYQDAKSYFEAHVDMAQPERERIQNHLATVEADLRTHTPMGLSQNQLLSRSERLDSLHTYWVKGEFPENLDFTGKLVPYFIDSRGVACAVGHLVLVSGYRAVALEVSRNQNNAFLREITDPRLAEWAHQSGLTLEECARNQPAYGGEFYSNIRSMEIDSLNRPWVIATEVLCSGCSALGYWEPTRWTIQKTGSSFQDLCITPSGKALVATSSGPLWNGQLVTPTDSLSSCEWNWQRQVAWMGSSQGFIRFNLLSGDTLSRDQTFPTALSNNSITTLAITRKYLWGGTSVGLSARQLSNDSLFATWNSTTLKGMKVTGLETGMGDSLWVGMDGLNRQKYPTANFEFSSKGLLRYDGQGNWAIFRSNNSALPCDTIQAIASRGGDSLWIACASGLYTFTPLSRVKKVSAIKGNQIHSMKVDSRGNLFVGTMSSGVFLLEKDTLKSISNPTIPVIVHTGKKNRNFGPLIRIQFANSFVKEIPTFTLTGRMSSLNSGVAVKRNHKQRLF